MVVDVPLPEDCLQHLVKHLDLRALVRASLVSESAVIVSKPMRHRAAPFRVCPSGRSPNNLHSLNCHSYTGRCVPARCAGHGGRLLPPLSHGSCSTPSLGGILSWSQGATRCVRRTARAMRCLWRFLRCSASGGSVQNVSSERRQQSASTTLRLRSGARRAFSDVCGISARRLKRSRETTGGGKYPTRRIAHLPTFQFRSASLKADASGEGLERCAKHHTLGP